MAEAPSWIVWRSRNSRILVALLLCIAIARAEPPPDVAALKRQMVKLREASKWTEAMPLAERIFVESARQHGGPHPNTADALHDWAWLVQANGDYDKAEELWREALAIDEALFGTNTVQTTRRLHLLANCYRDQGDYERALPLLRRALEIRERSYGRDHPETGQIVNSLGTLCMQSGDFAAAEAFLKRSVRIFDRGPDYYSPLTSALSGLGWLCLDLGDFDEAESNIRRALDLRMKRFGRLHTYTAGGLRELAVVHRHRGNLRRAEALLRESVQIAEEVLGTNHVEISGHLVTLGNLLFEMGDLEQAEALYQRAGDIIENTLGRDHVRFGSIRIVQSRILARRGDFRKAKALCDEGCKIKERQLGSSHHQTVAALFESARLDVALGFAPEVLAKSVRLQEAEERLAAQMLSFTSGRQRLAYRNGSWLSIHAIDLWASLNAPGPLAQSAFRMKGLMLDSLLEDRRLAEASADPEIIRIRRRMVRARTRLGQLDAALAPVHHATNFVNESKQLRAEIETCEALLARSITGFGGARRALSIQPQDILARVPERAVLVDLLRYRHYSRDTGWRASYGALVCLRTSDPLWVHLGPAEAIENAIKLHQHAVRTPGSDDALVQTSQDLHRLLWAPLAASLPATVRHVIVSPDGALNFVPFAALVTPSERFLGEDFSFSYVGAARDLLADEEIPARDNRLVIWADPEFGDHPGRAVGSGAMRTSLDHRWRGLNFVPLPGTRTEGMALRKRAREFGFDDAALYEGVNATEARIRGLRSPRALHLATHGFVLPDVKAPIENGDMDLQLSRSDAVPGLSPMLRSGLVLAGARHTLESWSEGRSVPARDDGILSADEIGGLDLRGTWLVVLSACDTGTGETLAGEGVLGLRRGFVQAGVRNLLLTLWPIRDEDSAALVADFYAAVHRTGSPPRGMAEVQRDWLQRLRTSRGLAEACRVAGPFILSFRGSPRLE